jgi:hypothetical protein
MRWSRPQSRYSPMLPLQSMSRQGSRLPEESCVWKDPGSIDTCALFCGSIHQRRTLIVSLLGISITCIPCPTTDMLTSSRTKFSRYPNGLSSWLQSHSLLARFPALRVLPVLSSSRQELLPPRLLLPRQYLLSLRLSERRAPPP